MKPREGASHTRDGVTKDRKRSPEAHRKDSGAQQVRLESNEQISAFFWMNEWEKAFQELKQYLSNPPLLSPSKEGENLYLYLVVSATAMNVALI